ncbi:MAG TPA: homocysteine S-methyltransferase family protein [Jatrophihabitans sp.]
MFETGTVTDGGLETDLIFHHGIDLPAFAAFPLLDDERGRALLTDYYRGYADIARDAGAGLVLESATWRANPDWGAAVGYDTAALDRVNRESIEFLCELREQFAVADTTIGGAIGPRGDGYRPGARVDPDEAAMYHRAQLDAFAAAGADLATAYTLTDPGEAVGVVLAARQAGLPIGISFTVETDGRLPDGTSLKDAIAAVDEAAPPDHFGVNCAHPTHVRPALEDGMWRERIKVLRANASKQSHAELDDADELDDGDPAELAAAQHAIAPLLPTVTVLGGCCGTDVRHVAALWNVSAT